MDIDGRKPSNTLLRRPIRVVWLNAEGSSKPSGHTFCFAGDGLPKYVRDGLARISAAANVDGWNSKQVRDACAAKNLRDFFDTQDVGRVLGIDLARAAVNLTAECSVSFGNMPGHNSREGGAMDDADDAELHAIERLLADEEESQSRAQVGHISALEGPAQVERAPTFPAGGLTIVPDMQMFPEDSFADIKRKIFVQTRIPTYRQHLVAIKSARSGREPGAMSISYNLMTTGPYPVSLCDLFAPNTDANSSMRMFDIPIDRAIYDARDDMHIEARDYVMTIEQIQPDFFIVVDLANWIVPHIEGVRAALGDNYQFELLYYGFVVKYFPQLTRECFHAYVANERSMADQFPDLAPAWSTVRSAVLAQVRISNMTHGARATSRLDIDHIIIRATTTSQIAGTIIRPINLRDLFDSIECSRNIIDVHAIVDSTGDLKANHRSTFRFEMRKFFKFSELMSASGVTHHTIGRIPSLGGTPGIVITFIYNTDDSGTTPATPMFMIIRPTGRVSFQFQWREEDEIGFGSMSDLFEEHTTRLLRELRESRVFAAANIEPVSAARMQILGLTVAVRWKSTISAKMFRLLREAWGDYIRAGIVIPRQTIKDTFSFIFTRGVNSANMQLLDQRLIAAGITESNHYTYLSVNAIRQKWIQNFAGHVVSVAHRATDVRFDVSDIYETEFAIFKLYLDAFIANFESTPMKTDEHDRGQDSAATGTDDHDRRRLRRLQEIDPVLYNLKKHGAPRVYSTRCQSGKQPILYSEQEARRGLIPRKAVRFWNFTTMKPAFYSCPDAKYPYLNFIVDIHPRGYCIPCCGKIKPSAGSKHAQIDRICTEDHSYNVTKLIEQPTGYIMSFGKDLSEGRLSHLPAGYLRDTLNRAVGANGAELLIFGVPQQIGIVHTLRAILGLSIADFVGAIARGIERGQIRFETIAGGRAATYFASKQAFAGYIASLSNQSSATAFPEGTADFMRAIMTDCVRAIFELEMVYLLTAEQSKDMRIIMPRSVRIANAAMVPSLKVGFAVVDREGDVHPVLTINPDDFARSGQVASRTLSAGCTAIIMQIALAESAKKTKNIDLEFIRAFCGSYQGTTTKYKIRKLYIGLRGLCYAVMLDFITDAGQNERAYIPVSYSGNINKRPDEEVGFDSLDDISSGSACLSATNAINDYIIKGKMPYHHITVEGYATLNGNPVALVLRAGTKMLAYFSSMQESTSLAQTMILSIDPRRHARALLTASRDTAAGVADNSLVARIAASSAEKMYPYYEYELFCIQFMMQTTHLRNTQMREKISTILASRASPAQKREELRELELSRRDLSIIASAMQSKNGRASLDALSLDIDLIELLQRIKDSPEQELSQWVIKFMRDATTPAGTQTPHVPAILTSCQGSSGAPTTGRQPHCDGSGKLMIRASLESLSEILASDLQKPLKRAYIFERGYAPESRASFADFTQRDSEVLLIKKYEVLP